MRDASASDFRLRSAVLFFGRFRRAIDGATAIEYALIAVGIGIAIVAGIDAVGGGVNTLFTNVGALF